jgi:hypothetical protein
MKITNKQREHIADILKDIGLIIVAFSISIIIAEISYQLKIILIIFGIISAIIFFILSIFLKR